MNEDEEIGRLANSLLSEVKQQTEDWKLSAYRSIIIAGRSTEALANSVLRKYHMNQSGFSILYVLIENSGSITQKRLGRVIGGSRQAIAWTLSAVEKRGLVTGSRIRGDQRRRIVKITRKGLELAAEIMLRQERGDFLSNLMSVLSQSQAKRLIGSLQRVIKQSREQMENYNDKGRNK